jgi:hypothetical protein
MRSAKTFQTWHLTGLLLLVSMPQSPHPWQSGEFRQSSLQSRSNSKFSMVQDKEQARRSQGLEEANER